jgi:acyl carrier protein
MKRGEFFKILVTELDLGDAEINEGSPLNITSLMSLSLISLLDEHFGIRVKATDLRKIDSVKKLVELIGKDKLSQ